MSRESLFLWDWLQTPSRTLRRWTMVPYDIFFLSLYFSLRCTSWPFSPIFHDGSYAYKIPLLDYYPWMLKRYTSCKNHNCTTSTIYTHMLILFKFMLLVFIIICAIYMYYASSYGLSYWNFLHSIKHSFDFSDQSLSVHIFEVIFLATLHRVCGTRSSLICEIC